MIKMTSRSFTLVEILVVITIVGVLLGVGGFSYSAALKSSRDSKRRADLEQIRAAIELYRSNSATSSYPVAATCAALDPLIDTYLPPFPSDPSSGSSYNCSSSASDYDIFSTLENATTTCTPPSGNCGATCRYQVGPYGKICGP